MVGFGLKIAKPTKTDMLKCEPILVRLNLRFGRMSVSIGGLARVGIRNRNNLKNIPRFFSMILKSSHTDSPKKKHNTQFIINFQ